MSQKGPSGRNADPPAWPGSTKVRSASPITVGGTRRAGGWGGGSAVGAGAPHRRPRLPPGLGPGGDAAQGQEGGGGVDPHAGLAEMAELERRDGAHQDGHGHRRDRGEGQEEEGPAGG